jgi:WS/DGAT/MGAT family acyltransferase
MSVRGVSPLDAVWLLLESRATPMHVGALLEFSLPEGAAPEFLRELFSGMRAQTAVATPWNLRPTVGRLPLLVAESDVDIDYHVRHSALPAPGGQRELGILVSRLHSQPLDLARPLWELHLIEGLEDNRFALYLKVHHSLIDGVSGIRWLLRMLSADPTAGIPPAPWTVGPSQPSPRRSSASEQGAPSIAAGLGRRAGAAGLFAPRMMKAGVGIARATLPGGGAPTAYMSPDSVLRARLNGQRRFATQRCDLTEIAGLAKAAETTINDIVLYLCGTALRRYLLEDGELPRRSLTAGIPVSLRSAEDGQSGTAISLLIAELGTNIPAPVRRLEAIKRSTRSAKRKLAGLGPEALAPYLLVVNGAYIAGLAAGLREHAPTSFNVAVSNVPGPRQPLYLNGARLDVVYPLSLLNHGQALNITCISYADSLGFGFTGARDVLPHLQRLAAYTGEALDELSALLATERQHGLAPRSLIGAEEQR